MSFRRKQIARPEHRSETATEAAEIQYAEEAWAPGLRLFQCTTWRARLTTKACSARWREAQTAVLDRADELAKCRGCALGAGHAGYPPVRYSDYFQKKICAQCGRGGMRIVGNRLCVSCWNRRRELKLGRNARGNLPVELLERPLVAVEVVVEVDGTLRRIRDPETSGVAETMLQALRTMRGEIRFPCASGWRPDCVSPLVEKALAPYLHEVARGGLADVNGGDPDPAPQVPRHCTPWHAQLFASTAFSGVRAAPLALAA